MMTKRIDAEHATLVMRVVEPSQRKLVPNERFNEGANLTRWGKRTDAAPTEKGFKAALQTATLIKSCFHLFNRHTLFIFIFFYFESAARKSKSIQTKIFIEDEIQLIIKKGVDELKYYLFLKKFLSPDLRVGTLHRLEKYSLRVKKRKNFGMSPVPIQQFIGCLLLDQVYWSVHFFFWLYR